MSRDLNKVKWLPEYTQRVFLQRDSQSWSQSAWLEGVILHVSQQDLQAIYSLVWRLHVLDPNYEWTLWQWWLALRCKLRHVEGANSAHPLGWSAGEVLLCFECIHGVIGGAVQTRDTDAVENWSSHRISPMVQQVQPSFRHVSISSSPGGTFLEDLWSKSTQGLWSQLVSACGHKQCSVRSVGVVLVNPQSI